MRSLLSTFGGIVLTAILLLSFSPGAWSNDLSEVRGEIAIFVVPQGAVQLKALVGESEAAIAGVLNSLGRFLPVENNSLRQALPHKDDYSLDEFHNVAEDLEVSLYIVLSIYHGGNEIVAEMKVVPLNPLYEGLRRNIVVKSRVLANIPLKLAREIALLHRNLPLHARIMGKKGDSLVLAAGQWHGLTAGGYSTADGRAVTVKQAGRYISMAEAPGMDEKREYVTLVLYPRVDEVIQRLDERIEANTLYRYGLGNTLLKGSDPERRFIESICVINPGANVCVPGYGSFLATEYLGFKNAKPHLPGVVLSSALFLNHLLLTEYMTGFKSNFFPWKQDGDKSDSMKSLHMFLWCSLPVTVTVSYFDQLAYQFSTTEHLPAFFQYPDETALAFSLLFPGGGLMYKGYRVMGWAYYAVEMPLAGFAAYNYRDGKKLAIALSALGTVKILEMVHAWFTDPAYEFRRYELRGGTLLPVLSLNALPGEGDEMIYRASLTARF